MLGDLGQLGVRRVVLPHRRIARIVARILKQGNLAVGADREVVPHLMVVAFGAVHQQLDGAALALVGGIDEVQCPKLAVACVAGGGDEIETVGVGCIPRAVFWPLEACYMHGLAVGFDLSSGQSYARRRL